MGTSTSTFSAVVKSGKWFSFSKKNDNQLLGAKLFFLNIILFLVTISFIVLFAIGFENSSFYTTFYVGYKNVTNNLPLYLRTIRSVGIFFMLWTCVFYLAVVYKSVNLTSFTLKLLCLFSIVPFFSLFLICYFCKKCCNKSAFFKSLFEDYPLANKKAIRSHWTYFVCLVGFIIISVYIPTTFYNAVVIKEVNQFKGYNFNLWFNSFIYFTVQSNYLCWISLGIYLIKPNWKIFRGYTLFNWVLTYITMTCLVYNIGRFTYMIFTGSNLTEGSAWYIILSGELAHVLNPITYVVVIVLLIRFRPVTKTNDLGFTMKFGIIVPTVYGLFLILSCFLTGISVYGPGTNFLPSLILYNVDENARGSYLVLLVFAFLVLMFLLFFYLWWLFIFKCVAKGAHLKISRESIFDMQNLKYQINELTN